MISQIIVLVVIALAGAEVGGVPSHRHICACPELYDPQCGSNGENFINKCHLDCYNSENKANVKVVHDGDCSDEEKLTLKNGVPSHHHICACPKLRNPKCGSNGENFVNECHLNCYNSENKANVKVVHDGYCSDEEKLTLKNVEEDGCGCHFEFKPVCGSNLKTYLNSCKFHCAANKDKSMKILHSGMCLLKPK